MKFIQTLHGAFVNLQKVETIEWNFDKEKKRMRIFAYVPTCTEILGDAYVNYLLYSKKITNQSDLTDFDWNYRDIIKSLIIEL